MAKGMGSKMAEKGLFTVSEFMKLTRTTRDTLIHYDRVGLLAPVTRGDNNYRYYSNGQLAVVNVIRTLQELGMTLEEIKSKKDVMTPALVNEILEQQNIMIVRKVDSLIRAQKLLSLIRKMINSVSGVNEDSITIQYMPEEAILMGELNDYSNGRTHYDALLSFYHTIEKKHPNMDLNYPVWGIFSEDRVRQGNCKWPDRFYFYNPEGFDKKPGAFYATGYTRGGYGQNEEVFSRVLDYIDRNGFEICGDTFEEYPLNEICINDSSNYLIRLMVTVREKSRRRH